MMMFAAVLCALGAIAPLPPILRFVLSLPLIFYLPGHALLEAAGRLESGVLRLVLAAGLSVAVTIFCGLALNLIGSMSRDGWAVALCAATLGGALLARLRDQPSRNPDVAARPPRMGVAQTMMLMAAGGVLCGAIVLSRQEALARHEFTYTQFWMVPDGDSLIAVGMTNAEASPTSYDIEVTLDGALVRLWRGIRLDVGESWTADLSLPTGSGSTGKAEARLFKNGDHQRVYRRVWLPASTEG